MVIWTPKTPRRCRPTAARISCSTRLAISTTATPSSPNPRLNWRYWQTTKSPSRSDKLLLLRRLPTSLPITEVKTVSGQTTLGEVLYDREHCATANDDGQRRIQLVGKLVRLLYQPAKLTGQDRFLTARPGTTRAILTISAEACLSIGSPTRWIMRRTSLERTAWADAKWLVCRSKPISHGRSKKTSRTRSASST